MQNTSSDKVIRILCAVMFVTFAFCWTFFFQAGLLEAAYSGLVGRTGLRIPYNRLAMSVVLVLVSMLFVLPSRRIHNFRNGLVACNYILSAIFLGALTGYHQPARVWIFAALFAILLIVICRIVASVPKPDIVERSFSGAILIMTLLFCLIAILGNTDENTHRQLLIERYMEKGEYEKALQVGRFEEESNEAIDLLRAKALIATGQIGDELFQYSICNPSVLADSLDGEISLLLKGDLQAFCSTIDLSAYSSLPRYYMQAMVLAGDQRVQDIYPEDYTEASDQYTRFLEVLDSVKDTPQQYQSNATFLDFHETYYWVYYFRLNFGTKQLE